MSLWMEEKNHNNETNTHNRQFMRFIWCASKALRRSCHIFFVQDTQMTRFTRISLPPQIYFRRSLHILRFVHIIKSKDDMKIIHRAHGRSDLESTIVMKLRIKKQFLLIENLNMYNLILENDAFVGIFLE